MNPFEILIIVVIAVLILGMIYNTTSKIISSKISKSKLPKIDFINNPSDIHNLIDLAINEKTRIKLKINNREPSYNTSIIKKESILNHHTLQIDSLFPPEGNDKIQHSFKAVAEFIIKGIATENQIIPYSFTTNYIDQKDYENFKSLRITFPKAINRRQKREFLRVEPSVNKPLFIKFKIKDNKMTQKIENISAGGISFFTNLTKTVLWPGKRIEKILITLPDQSQLTCPILIRSIFRNNDPIFIGGKRYSYSCGAQFLEIDNNVRDNIIKYVLEKERNELKHLHREFE
jgi:c-di-GMP-binding flagellar brake protein YcgR